MQGELFAVAGPGLEALVAAELGALGLGGVEEPGGVSFPIGPAGAGAIARANLHLAIATRVLLRVGSFHAAAFHELGRGARRVPWERWLSPGACVRVRVTCHRSRLYHTGAIAERLLAAMSERTGAVTRAAADDEEDDDALVPLVIARFDHDACTLSVDTSGAPLHRRGYRLATAKAPLRETLAAAVLRAAGYDGRAPLVDPMCGSGTLAIEAARLARRMAPGIGRRFAFESWPDGEHARTIDPLRARAAEAVLPACPAPIRAGDHDAGAIRAARQNAKRAGVEADVELAEAALSAITPPSSAPGLVVGNPPYGVRIGDRGRVERLHRDLGAVLRARFSGWTLALITAGTPERALGIPVETRLRTRNGGIPVRLLVGAIR